MDTRPGTIRLARIAGTEIFVHVSWVIIAGLVLLSFWGQLDSEFPELDEPWALLLAVIGAVVFFSSVLLHELAHALTAKRRGIEVKGITLYLFGGATEADASSKSAGDEFIIAIVGPLSSFLIAVVLGLCAVLFGDLDDPVPTVLAYLAGVNVLLAIFNLAPGLPLDGGRVFRSAVWAATGDFAKATRWATAAGVGLGYALIAAGLLSVLGGAVTGLWLVFIGWMITQSARQNEAQESIRSVFTGLAAGDVMTSPVITIPASTTIAEAANDYFAHGNQTAFPVLDGDRVVGLLTLEAIRGVPGLEVSTATAGRVAAGRPPAHTTTPDAPMLEVVDALSSEANAKARVLVFDRGRLVGIISPSDILRRRALSDLLGPPPPASRT
jgi:Zn-dependent protease/CBS domain-containing protein